MIKLYFALTILIGTYSKGLVRQLLFTFNDGKVASTLSSKVDLYSNSLYILAFILSVIIFKQIEKSYDLNLKNKKCIVLKLGLIIFYSQMILKIIAVTPLMYIVFRLEFLRQYAFSYLPISLALILVIVAMFRIFLETTPKLSKI
jgi:hypothetical protein